MQDPHYYLAHRKGEEAMSRPPFLTPSIKTAVCSFFPSSSSEVDELPYGQSRFLLLAILL